LRLRTCAAGTLRYVVIAVGANPTAPNPLAPAADLLGCAGILRQQAMQARGLGISSCAQQHVQSLVCRHATALLASIRQTHEAWQTLTQLGHTDAAQIAVVQLAWPQQCCCHSPNEAASRACHCCVTNDSWVSPGHLGRHPLLCMIKPAVCRHCALRG
jgi:hypothetical protein